MNPLSAENASPTPTRAKYMVYVVWGMVVALIALFVAVAHRAVTDARRAEECSTNLKRIGVALQQYYDRCGSFPPAFVLNEQGERWHSWRVLLLPDLGYPDLYDQYCFDEPWNGPRNRQLLERMPDVYGCPADRDRPAENTNYFAIVGPQTAWPEQYALRLEHVTDGTANTACLLEGVDAGIAWLEPRDFNHADLTNGAYHSNPRPRLRHTKTDLIVNTWPDELREKGVSDNALYQVIVVLRRKIEPNPATPRYLVTWRGKPEGGYQFFPEGKPG